MRSIDLCSLWADLCAAIDALLQRWRSGYAACVIVASPEGVQTVLEHDSTVRLFACAIDEGLNEDAYIVLAPVTRVIAFFAPRYANPSELALRKGKGIQ